MNYWELRDGLASVLLRSRPLMPIDEVALPRVGRRGGEFLEHNDLLTSRYIRNDERNLSTKFSSPFEISTKSCGCPLPLNVDVYDGLICPYQCIYCFANAFRHSLYNNFSDNAQTVGLRQADLGEVRKFIEGALSGRLKTSEARALEMGMPARVGVRFENFIPAERKNKTALKLLKMFAYYRIPVLIDTKSDILGEEEWIRALADNPSGAVVQFSLISNDAELLKQLEPGAPSPAKRLEAMRRLNQAGVTAMPRLEPFLPYVADERSAMLDMIDAVKAAGARYSCWDGVSYSVCDSLTKRLFAKAQIDFERLFTTASESRLMTGLFLHYGMEEWRQRGITCSTYDDMNSYNNGDVLCCNVSHVMPGVPFHRGSTKAAEAYIRSQSGPVSWGMYEQYVSANGGWLNDSLHAEMRRLWNCDGNTAYSLGWLGVVPAGADGDGMLWRGTVTNDNLEYAKLYAKQLIGG